uniref:Pr6Pr family membrane protein n=1 Tax=uncultured Altererythrobacter sp. TaxID=500840 RepID=UPI00261BE824|nr:Pr6Pr family membrane protein [uncultured Altererythrobacter sp.]
MKDQVSTFGRSGARIIGFVALGTLALQTTINTEPGTTPLENFALLFRFFTIWSNFAGGVAMLWIAAGKPISERVTFALATALTIVALVYHALLAADHHPVDLDWWTNLNFHTVIPATFVLWWAVFSDRAHLTWRSLPWVMVFPIIYTAFALIYGASTGFYAYFFLDLPSLGWGQLLLNMIGLSLFFVAMGAVLLALRKLLRRDPA